MPGFFSHRVFGDVKLATVERSFPAALEKTAVPSQWIVEFFIYDAPWNELKQGDVITFSSTPNNHVRLTVSEDCTETEQ